MPAEPNPHAFHNHPAVKRFYLERVADHRQSDRLIQGLGWKNGKGCAIGCTLGGYDHWRFPGKLGLPVSLAYLEDHIFEALPEKDAMGWPERFLRAIPINADALAAVHRWALWLVGGADSPLAQWRTQPSLLQVAQLIERQLDGRPPGKAQWQAAEAAALGLIGSPLYTIARPGAWLANGFESTNLPFSAINEIRVPLRENKPRAFATAAVCAAAIATDTAWQDLADDDEKKALQAATAAENAAWNAMADRLIAELRAAPAG